jgi:hypothetical protein
MTDKLLHSPEVEGVQLLVLQRSLQECVRIIGLDGRVHIHFLQCASRFENCIIKVTYFFNTEIQVPVLDYSTESMRRMFCSFLVQYATGLTVLVAIVKRTHCHAVNMQFNGYSF